MKNSRIFRVRLHSILGHSDVYLDMTELQNIESNVHIEFRGQYTGFKDIYNDRIFEGDIVSFKIRSRFANSEHRF